jgi:hypothetical protein
MTGKIAKKMGRPSIYKPKIAEKICDRMILGNSIRSICGEEGMPSEATLYRWLVADSDFRQKYRAAREIQKEAFLEEMLREATDRTGDFFMDGNQLRPNTANVMRSKVITDNLKWVMGRMIGSSSAAGGPVSFSFDNGPVTAITRTIVYPGAKPPEPPRLLTFDPGALPQALDEQIKNRALRMIKDNVPSNDQRAPNTIVDEVFSICQQALQLHYREVTVESAALATFDSTIARETSANLVAAAETASATR